MCPGNTHPCVTVVCSRSAATSKTHAARRLRLRRARNARATELFAILYLVLSKCYARNARYLKTKYGPLRISSLSYIVAVFLGRTYTTAKKKVHVGCPSLVCSAAPTRHERAAGCCCRRTEITSPVITNRLRIVAPPGSEVESGNFFVSPR